MEHSETALAADKLYMQLNASELSAIISKGSPHSNDRDAGFCSGSSEGGDDLSIDHSRLEPSSPADAAEATDTSEDSVEVKVMPISLTRNKRKSSEPSKVIFKREESASTAPLKKRIRYTSSADSGVVVTPPALVSPLSQSRQPQSQSQPQLWDSSQVLPHELMPNPAAVFVRHPGVTTLHRIPASTSTTTTNTIISSPASGNGSAEEQLEPLALVLRKPAGSESASSPGKILKDEDEDDPVEDMELASDVATVAAAAAAALEVATSKHSPSLNSSSSGGGGGGEGGGGGIGNSNGRPQQRNYKNMTRERRIEANARERTRVHTISAAYETLRRAVPSYSHAQKLSKLSVLRVACAYILTLSRMAGYDYSEDQSEPSIASCFEAVTATIQTEGKIRKKKDE